MFNKFIFLKTGLDTLHCTECESVTLKSVSEVRP